MFNDAKNFDYRVHAEAPLPDNTVRRVMADLGLDYMQARNHVRGLLWLREQAQRRAPRLRDFSAEM